MKRPVSQPPAWATGFPAVEPKRARILILGTLPSAESIRQGQYYAHSRNAFWPIMGELFGAGREWPYERRLRKLAAQGVMLWDVLRAAQRPGSLDSAIDESTMIGNDFAALFARCPQIRSVYFNGAAAERCFRRGVLPTLPDFALPTLRLPSTSPAHAGQSFAQKLAAWRAVMPPTAS